MHCTHTLVSVFLLYKELGHAFGIPHADENHFNINLGNCMDYTNRPWSNTTPDKHTFELLQEVYDPNGLLTNENDNMLSTITTKTSLSATVPRINDNMDDDSTVPASITARAKKHTASLESSFGSDRSHVGWVPLESNNEKVAAFRMDLGDGFSLQTHFLLA